MKLTVLVENTSAREGIGVEHGLSLYMEACGRKILFDMGQSDLFLRNAKKLGIDLAEVNLAILSHGHYDHGGGLSYFLQCNQKAPVYLNPFAFEPHYHGIEKYIGLDQALKDHPRLIFAEPPSEINGQLSLCSVYGRKNLYRLGSFGLSTMEEGTLVHDDFRHENCLLIREGEKRILISGCSHQGILNLAEAFRPDVLVGGFHFSKLPLDSTLSSYAAFLDSFDTKYYTCHCTGEEQFSYMKRSMSRLYRLSAGESIEL